MRFSDMAHLHMTPEHDIAQRKRQLLAEGAIYRASLAASMQEVRQNLSADSLARRAAGFVATAALGMIKGRAGIGGGIGSIGGIGMQSLLPLAIEAFSLFSKKPFLKKILRTAAVVATAMGAANMFLRKKKSAKQDPEHEEPAQAGDETG
jgi:hypothetical protein